MVFACRKIKRASWGACQDYGAAFVGRACVLGFGVGSVRRVSFDVKQRAWLLLFAASLVNTTIRR